MRTKNLLLLLLLGVLLATAPFVKADEYEDDEDYDEEGGDDGEPSEKDVVVLTNENFDEIIKKAKFALVEFYAPWCGHCKNLKPHYAKAATELKAYDPEIVIAKVDVTEQKELGEKFEIKGFPTLKWFKDGEVAMDYGGGRDAAGIKGWVISKSGPPSVTIKDIDELKQKTALSDVTVVGYFPSSGKLYEAFKEVGGGMDGVMFVDTESADIAKELNLKKKPSVAVLRNFKGSEPESDFREGDFTAESLKEYVMAQKTPLTIEFSQENAQIIFQSGISKQIILWGADDDIKAGSPAYKALASVAAEMRGKLMFVTAPKDKSTTDAVTKFFGLEKSPSVVGAFLEKQQKFALDGEITEKSLLAFAKSVFDGSAEPSYKSADIPAEPLDGGVAVVVGKSFNSIVLDEKKDVLLEVYAPWCGHCKQLEPIYKDLAKLFDKVDSVVIAKMDGTENEHARIQVKGFPTIIFFPAGKDVEPINFDGERTVAGMAKFIKDNAASKFDMPAVPSDDDEDLDEYDDEEEGSQVKEKDEL